MHPDRMVLSAYLDGEVPDRFVSAIEHSIQTDPAVRAMYNELSGIRARLSQAPLPDVTDSAERSWIAVRQRLLDVPAPRAWSRGVRLPIPALAAAALVVAAVLTFAIWSLLPDKPGSTREYLANGQNVDVTIRVDGPEMEEVLQWLVEQNMLGEVSIQLPEQRFELMGEPVLVKPGSSRGGLVE